MSSDSSDDGIQEEMDRVRGDLGGGIDKLGEQVRSMLDWQTYIRSAPLASVAIAAAAGFLIAPRIRSKRVYAITGNSAAASTGPGILGTIANVVVTSATQAASLYLGNLITRELSAQMAMEPATHSDLNDAYGSTHDFGD